jgi:hypothetical protein
LATSGLSAWCEIELALAFSPAPNLSLPSCSAVPSSLE